MGHRHHEIDSLLADMSEETVPEDELPEPPQTPLARRGDLLPPKASCHPETIPREWLRRKAPVSQAVETIESIETILLPPSYIPCI